MAALFVGVAVVAVAASSLAYLFGSWNDRSDVVAQTGEMEKTVENSDTLKEELVELGAKKTWDDLIGQKRRVEKLYLNDNRWNFALFSSFLLGGAALVGGAYLQKQSFVSYGKIALVTTGSLGVLRFFYQLGNASSRQRQEEKVRTLAKQFLDKTAFNPFNYFINWAFS